MHRSDLSDTLEFLDAGFQLLGVQHFEADELVKERWGGPPPVNYWGEVIVLAGALEQIRSLVNVHAPPPEAGHEHRIIITSGYRSPDYNHRVGGAIRSQHLFGRAADFVVPTLPAAEVQSIIDGSDLADRLGMGYGSTFTHIDTRHWLAPASKPARWSY